MLAPLFFFVFKGSSLLHFTKEEEKISLKSLFITCPKGVVFLEWVKWEEYKLNWKQTNKKNEVDTLQVWKFCIHARLDTLILEKYFFAYF